MPWTQLRKKTYTDTVYPSTYPFLFKRPAEENRFAQVHREKKKKPSDLLLYAQLYVYGWVEFSVRKSVLSYINIYNIRLYV